MAGQNQPSTYQKKEDSDDESKPHAGAGPPAAALNDSLLNVLAVLGLALRHGNYALSYTRQHIFIALQDVRVRKRSRELLLLPLQLDGCYLAGRSVL